MRKWIAGLLVAGVGLIGGCNPADTLKRAREEAAQTPSNSTRLAAPAPSSSPPADSPAAQDNPVITWPAELVNSPHALLLGDKLIVVQEDGKGLEALAPGGQVLWTVPLGERIDSLLYDADGARALVVCGETGEVVDLNDGARLGSAPPLRDNFKEGLFVYWRGDLVLSGQEQKQETVVPELKRRVKMPAGVRWTVYRLTSDGRKLVWNEAFSVLGGVSFLPSEDGRSLLLSGNTSPRQWRVYRDDKPVHTLSSANVEMTYVMASQGDALYGSKPGGGIAKFTLTGDLLWQRQVSGWWGSSMLWPRDGGELWFVGPEDGGKFAVVDGRGERVFGGTGHGTWTSGRYLLVSVEPESVLYNARGQVVARYSSAFARMTRNRNWIYLLEGAMVKVYPVPD